LNRAVENASFFSIWGTDKSTHFLTIKNTNTQSDIGTQRQQKHFEVERFHFVRISGLWYMTNIQKIMKI
jgi:hypothetical protein